MKCYLSEKKKVKESIPFVTDIEEIKDKDGNTTMLGIILEGTKWVPVPNTLENLNKFREIMNGQGRKMQTLLSNKKRLANKCRIGTVIGVAGIAGTLILNATEIGKEINPLIPGFLSGGFTLSCGIGEIVNSKAISYIQKVGIFIAHEKLINEYVATNPYVYCNVRKSEQSKIEQMKKENPDYPITIERLDELENKTIKTIWNNVKFYNQHGITYEEPILGKQKTLEQA